MRWSPAKRPRYSHFSCMGRKTWRLRLPVLFPFSINTVTGRRKRKEAVECSSCADTAISRQPIRSQKTVGASRVWRGKPMAPCVCTVSSVRPSLRASRRSHNGAISVGTVSEKASARTAQQNWVQLAKYHIAQHTQIGLGDRKSLKLEVRFRAVLVQYSFNSFLLRASG